MGAEYSVSVTVREHVRSASGLSTVFHTRQLRGTSAHDKIFGGENDNSNNELEYVVYALDCDTDTKISDDHLESSEDNGGGFGYDFRLQDFSGADHATLCFIFPQGLEPSPLSMDDLRRRDQDGAYCGRFCDDVNGEDIVYQNFGTIQLV